VLKRSRNARDPAAVIEAVKADVSRFAESAEVADDLTLLVLRWNGPNER
jgi:serine phosphatase RsbU (regulator of sigma subunit)